MPTELPQELMTPDEAAKWFRRSPTWLRRQRDLVRLAGGGGQPLYHVRVCRAYVLGSMRGLSAEDLREVQLAALALACGLPTDAGFRAVPGERAEISGERNAAPQPKRAPQPDEFGSAASTASKVTSSAGCSEPSRRSR